VLFRSIKQQQHLSSFMSSSTTFDLQKYISQYRGHTKIKRLLFIADNSEKHRAEAIELAIQELKNGINTNLYKEVVERYGKELNIYLDTTWLNDTEQQAQKTLEKLEIQLNTARNNMMKEATRTGSNEIGDFYFRRGDFQNALKNYLRSRDYCTSSRHVVEMCLNVIRVSIEMGNYALVQQYVSKAEQTPDVSNQEDIVSISKLSVASALVNLDSKKYKVVAKKFLSCDISMDNEFNHVISCNDITVYAGITALATFERRELKEKVLESASFKNFLELNPSIRQLLVDFYESKYTSALSVLDSLLVSNNCSDFVSLFLEGRILIQQHYSSMMNLSDSHTCHWIFI
jgi:COP9 signalosome complex subunit 1